MEAVIFPVLSDSTSARFLVCEKTGVWATVLGREPKLSGIRIHPLRSLAQCQEEMSVRTSYIAALEATSQNIDLIVSFIWRSHAFPAARIVVLAPGNLADCEWDFREAGAAHVALGRRSLACVASIVSKHLDAAMAAQSGAHQPMVSRLPWAADADDV